MRLFFSGGHHKQVSHLILLWHNWRGPLLLLLLAPWTHTWGMSEKTDACGNPHEKGCRICSSASWVETYGVSCVDIMQWLTCSHSRLHTNCYLTQTVTLWLWVWCPRSCSPFGYKQWADSTVQPLILPDQSSHWAFITSHNALHTLVMCPVTGGGWMLCGGAHVSRQWFSTKTKNNNNKSSRI